MPKWYVRNRLWHLQSPEQSYRRQGFFDLLDSDKTILTHELATTPHGTLMSGPDNVFCDNARYYLDYVEYEQDPEWASETEERALVVKGFCDRGQPFVLAHDCVVGLAVDMTGKATRDFLTTPFPTLQHAAATDQFVMVRARQGSVLHYASVEARFRPVHDLFSYLDCSQNSRLLARALSEHLSKLGLAPIE